MPLPANVIVFTPHCKTALHERGIDERWVEATLMFPDWTASDPRPDRTRAFKAIPERQGRFLRVVYAETPMEIRVITAFFDRDAKKR